MERLAAPMMVLSRMYEMQGSYVQSAPAMYGRNEQVNFAYATQVNPAYRRSYAAAEASQYNFQRGPQRVYAPMPEPVRFVPRTEEAKREVPAVREQLPPREYTVIPFYVSKAPEASTDRRQELAQKIQQALFRLEGLSNVHDQRRAA
jgi:hypothetical protein